MEINTIINGDCIQEMSIMNNDCVDLTLTDIPYDGVNRKSNGLRVLDKENADIKTFDLQTFLGDVYKITKGTIIIFCGQNQLSEIFDFFKNKKGTTRQLIWQKSNPSPMNGQNIYLSGIENAIWFKKRGGTFNAHCKNTVFKYPNGSSKLHPTEKNHKLLQELIIDNSNENDIVFDPCCGSGSHCFNAFILGRQFLGIELNKDYLNMANKRLMQNSLFEFNSEIL
jgi:DNA modification methylase